MQTKWVVAVLAIIIVAGTLIYLYFPTPEQPKRIPPVDLHYVAPASVEIHHSTVDGANIYSGTLPFRECNTFSSGLSVVDYPPNVHIRFTVFDGNGSCLEETGPQDTPQPFSLSFKSNTSTTTPIIDSVSINGNAIPFTVVEDR